MRLQKALYLTQPSLSNALKELENEMKGTAASSQQAGDHPYH